MPSLGTATPIAALSKDKRALERERIILAIAEAALKNRNERFVLDDEAVVLCVDGQPDFNALHSGKHNEEVQFCAFDVLARLTEKTYASCR